MDEAKALKTDGARNDLYVNMAIVLLAAPKKQTNNTNKEGKCKDKVLRRFQGKFSQFDII